MKVKIFQVTRHGNLFSLETGREITLTFSGNKVLEDMGYKENSIVGLSRKKMKNPNFVLRSHFYHNDDDDFLTYVYGSEMIELCKKKLRKIFGKVPKKIYVRVFKTLL